MYNVSYCFCYLPMEIILTDLSPFWYEEGHPYNRKNLFPLWVQIIFCKVHSQEKQLCDFNLSQVSVGSTQKGKNLFP